LDKDKTTDKAKISDKGKTTIITTIVVGVFITLLGSIFSPVFSPLSENIKDGFLGEPDTKITSAMTFDYNDKKVSKPLDPNDTISTRSITFNFKANESSKSTPLGNFLSLLGIKHHIPYFECSIDGKPFEECMSPKPYANLDTEVDHLFQVRAKSILGNTDKSPDKFYVTTITSASVYGQIKENRTVYDNSEITLDVDKNYRNTTKTDDKGRFLFEEVGKGPHTIDVFYKENNQTQYDNFFVPPAVETFKLNLDIKDMSPKTDSGNFTEQNSEDPNPNWKLSNDTSKVENITIDLKVESKLIQKNPIDISTKISINAPSHILSNIEYVEYYLHPTFTPNIVKSFSKDNNFLLTLKSYGTFDLKAKVFLKDGTVKDLELSLAEWERKIPNLIDLKQESKLIQKNPTSISTKISIDIPNRILSNIEHVEYYLHPTFNPNIVKSFNKDNNFLLNLTSYGTFDLKAKVFLKDGTVKDLELPSEEWEILS
jgi:transcription initiation factor IIF auxiliary subunit